jgi:hypothetical protein
MKSRRAGRLPMMTAERQVSRDDAVKWKDEDSHIEAASVDQIINRVKLTKN